MRSEADTASGAVEEDPERSRSGSQPARTASRRRVLGATAGVAVGVSSLAGCLSWGDDEPAEPPIEVDAEAIERLLSIDSPEVPEPVSIEATAAHAESSRDRAESLLAAVPADLEATVPNEAVRSDIETATAEAREYLSAADADFDADSGSAGPEVLDSLRRARRNAARAEGMVAVPEEDRTREDVFEAADSVRSSFESLESELTRVGDRIERTLFVYEHVEENLESARSILEDGIGRIAPASSEVEAVGEGSEFVEHARARIEEATHFHDRQPSHESFDEAFRASAETLLEAAEPRIEGLPEDPDEVVATEFRARGSIGMLVRRIDRRLEQGRERIEEDRIALGLLLAVDVSLDLEAVERIESLVDTGDHELPETAAALEEPKREAIEALEEAGEAIDDTPIGRYALDRAAGRVDGGDWYLEQIEEHGLDIDGGTAAGYAIDAYDSYVLAEAYARGLPETVASIRGTIEDYRT